MKKLKIEYGDGVFALPRESILSALPSANEFNLKVLLLTASDESLRSDFSKLTAEVCARLDCTENALKKVSKDIYKFAMAEGLGAHAKSAVIRGEKD